jgi:hypothetical protein
MKVSCIDTFDAINCGAAVGFCDSELSTNMWASGRNVYDISKVCSLHILQEGSELFADKNPILAMYR